METKQRKRSSCWLVCHPVVCASGQANCDQEWGREHVREMCTPSARATGCSSPTQGPAVSAGAAQLRSRPGPAVGALSRVTGENRAASHGSPLYTRPGPTLPVEGIVRTGTVRISTQGAWAQSPSFLLWSGLLCPCVPHRGLMACEEAQLGYLLG